MKDATISSLPAGRTDDLIRSMAMEAGDRARERGKARTPTLRQALAAGLVLALICSLATVILLSGPRPDLSNVATTWTFQFKVVAMTLAAGGASLMVRNAVIPGIAGKRLLPLLPAALFMLAGAGFDRSGLSLGGAHASSVTSCMGVIVIAALPALAVIFAAMRRGIPTRPRLAGTLAGILAGSLGGLAYTIACINDGAAFVALWYTLAIALVTAIGAIAGPRVLAW
ncbi:DUF1109 domain-containing protein [Neorhizobium sp. NCHU2750]|uniref:NrsF family protein n=1 Tax=Neorhizobium sp. NCHU2750 TaxID=1825976 RepID=UPI000EB684F6|nr:hypothetical protein NCHU2750_40570 [Neorhizobium sp. NCHU2750]